MVTSDFITVVTIGRQGVRLGIESCVMKQREQVQNALSQYVPGRSNRGAHSSGEPRIEMNRYENQSQQVGSTRDNGNGQQLISQTAINPAFFQEIKDDNLELRLLLRNVELRIPDLGFRTKARRHLVSVLTDLREQLALHFSLEEAYGYFLEPLAVAPELSRRAEQLRAQHVTLYKEICEIVELIHRITGNRRPSNWVSLSQRLLHFCGQLQEHEHGEQALIADAYCEDLGVAD